MVNESLTKLYGVFDNFSESYQVTKIWMIKQCLSVSDVIHGNKHNMPIVP